MGLPELTETLLTVEECLQGCNAVRSGGYQPAVRFIAYFTLHPWKWQEHVSVKHRLTLEA